MHIKPFNEHSHEIPEQLEENEIDIDNPIEFWVKLDSPES